MKILNLRKSHQVIRKKYRKKRRNKEGREENKKAKK